MKKLILISSIVLAHAAAFAQGTVNFSNASTALGDTTRLNHWTDLPQPGVVLGVAEYQWSIVYFGLLPGALVSSNEFPSLRAQLYWGASTATSLTQLTAVTGPPALFRSTTSANVGAWNGGNRTVDQWAAGEHHELAVIIWDAAQVPDGLAALGKLATFGYTGLYGQSALFDYVVPGTLDPPSASVLANLSGFDVGFYSDFIPEPSALALAALGTVATLIVRRRR